MDVPPHRIGRLALGVLVIGVLLAGWGVSLDGTNPCRSGYLLDVRPVEAGATPEGVVAFDDLPAAERRAFEESRSADQEPVYPSVETVDELNGAVVEYEDRRYAVHVIATSCSSPGLVPTSAGVGLAAVGGLLALGALGWWGIRRRRSV